MAYKRESQFFGSLPPMSEAFACAVHERWTAHENELENSHRDERMRRSWAMYYSRSRSGDYDDTEVSAGGSSGELTIVKPGEYRSLMQAQLALVTQAPPGYDCTAVNTSSKALAQAILGNGVLDFYLRAKSLADYRVRRAEIALLFGESFLVSYWDTEAGEKYVPTADGRGVVYEGDLAFRVFTPYDVAYDPLSPDLQRPRWSIVREPMNRWDLIAQYPESRAEILNAEPYSSILEDWGIGRQYDHDDYIPVLRVGVERCKAQPEGREALVLSEKKVLYGGPLEEDRVGVFRLAAGEVVFQAGGHTNNFEAMPMIEMMQAQVSTIASNHMAFGGQTIAAPKGSGIQPHHLGRGIHLFEYVPYDDATGKPMPPPGPMQMLQTPQEMFTFYDLLKGAAERYSGIHAVLRGETNASDSGSKTAFLAATSQQFANQFHRNLARSDEDVGSFVIASLCSHANNKRVATIAGKASGFANREFDGEDLEMISRVTVRAQNPMRDTFMGRLELWDRFVAAPPEDREKLIEMVNTGRVDTITDGPQQQALLIERENEQLRDPAKPMPIVVPTDDHHKHLAEHRCVYDDPEVRESQDTTVRDRTKEHIQWHLDSITPGTQQYIGDQLAAAYQQQPLPPMGSVNGMMPGAPPPGQQGQGEQPKKPDPNGAPGGMGGKPGGGPMPRMPKGPKNALTGERAEVATPEAAGGM